MEKSEKLVLIDGHAILHRAFHALPPLTTSGGQQAGAVFGFCSMLLRVIQDLKPGFLAVAFDLPKPTFRQKLYANYQAQRPQMAEELSSQVEVVHQVLQVMEIPIFEKEGYEADDLIGTLALAATGPVGLHPRPTSSVSASRRQIPAGARWGSPAPATPPPPRIEVIIVTGDRDMLQLVEERVKVYAPIKGITQTILYDEKLVEEKYGLKPSQWVDYKALMGDPSDNYPGVTGVGPKTAMNLLKKFGTLEKIYENPSQLPEKLASSLIRDKEKVDLAKKLAQIDIDVPLEFDLGKCRLKDLKNPKVENLFEEFEFKSLWKRINGGKQTRRVKEKPHKKENKDQLKLI
ncbi:MAG: 5'-3' exonuclease H3TH domain-containing protein [bacterium]|nr:5'-3' exonuclease H3TH domain-containing protein [bacterium]